MQKNTAVGQAKGEIDCLFLFVGKYVKFEINIFKKGNEEIAHTQKKVLKQKGSGRNFSHLQKDQKRQLP